MRDYLFFGVIFGALPFCFYRPYIGILFWAWIGLMNPHRFGWSAAYNFPVAHLFGGVTLAGIVFAFLRKESFRLPWNRETILLILLWLSFTLTTFFAVDKETAWSKWEMTSKILLMNFVAILFLQEKKKLEYLLVVISLSIGFFGVKGGIFGLHTGGQYIVFGPRESFITDNNALALAELMVLPILFYLGKEQKGRFFKYGLYIMGILTILSIVLSYSRGALVGLICVCIFLAVTSSKKIFVITLLVLGCLLVSTSIPPHWLERMTSIKTYQEDHSAMSRINGWIFAYNLASAFPLTGGGFGAFNKELFEKYAPKPDDVYDGHSVYFQVLGEHGFLGLGLFLSLLLSSILSMQKVKKVAQQVSNLGWARHCAIMLQLSLAAYAICGAFLPLAYFDLYYYIVASAILLKMIIKKRGSSTVSIHTQTSNLGVTV
jgi:probable O-glycosylation ligase (exosortase A-associated)